MCRRVSCHFGTAHSARCWCLGPKACVLLLYQYPLPVTGATAAALPSTMHARSRRPHPTITTQHHHRTSLVQLLLLLYRVSQCVFPPVIYVSIALPPFCYFFSLLHCDCGFSPSIYTPP